MNETYESDVLKCPACGYIERDAWELSPEKEDGETNCARCNVRIIWSRCVSVNYRGRLAQMESSK